MKKYILFFCVCASLFECKNSENNQNINLRVNNKSSIRLVDSLNIITPDSVPVQYSDGYILSDSLFYGIGFNNKIEVFDLNNQKHLKTFALDRNTIKGDIQNIIIPSKDSIFVFNSYPPGFYLINNEGVVKRHYSLSNININIDRDDIPEDEIFYTLPKYYGYVKPQYLNHKLYIPIAPMGAEEMEGFTETERVGIYNLIDEKWEKAIIPPKGILATLANTYYNYDLMNTFFIIAENKLYVNYPISNFSYRYNLDGVFIDSVNTSSELIKKFPKPMSQKELFDRQQSWNFRITTPFYGPLFYHKKSKVFTRTAYQEQALKLANNKLNNGNDRTASLMLFDQDFTQKKEVFFEKATLGIGKNYPLQDGIVIGRQENYWINEDQFIHKYIYKFNVHED